jgi:hypothetical protein
VKQKGLEGMSRRRPTPENTEPGPQDEREARLAAALRANLRRRKAAARERDAAAKVKATDLPK